MARAGFPAVAIPPSAARDVQIAVQNIRARLEALESSYAPSKTVNAQIASVSAQIGTSSSSSSSSGIADALSNGITYGRENASWVQVLPQPIASSTNAAYDIVFYDGTSAALISSALTFNPSTKALSIGGTLHVTGSAQTGALTVTGNENVTGTLTVTGNENVTGTLTVTGNENVTGTLTVTGDVFAPNILNFTASASAPGSPNVGDRWVNTSNGVQYTWFNDGSGNQWVQFT